MTRVRLGDVIHDRGRIRKRASDASREQVRIQCALEIDAVHQRRAGHEDDADVDPGQDAGPHVDLRKQASPQAGEL